jgi:dTDP-4-dehydrorhamnose reductase
LILSGAGMLGHKLWQIRAERFDTAITLRLTSIAVSALFPHRLARLCQAADARLIHLSTDCVFSGHRGGYREDDPANPIDLYGRRKLLGEVVGAGCLTDRGHEARSDPL